jgi:hypothetical protein
LTERRPEKSMRPGGAALDNQTAGSNLLCARTNHNVRAFYDRRKDAIKVPSLQF